MPTATHLAVCGRNCPQPVLNDDGEVASRVHGETLAGVDLTLRLLVFCLMYVCGLWACLGGPEVLWAVELELLMVVSRQVEGGY